MATVLHSSPYIHNHHRRKNQRRMKKRRLSIQAIFAAKDEPQPQGHRNYKTLPRSFAAYAHEYAHYDDATTIPTPDSSDSSFLLDDDPFADLSGGPKLDAPSPMSKRPTFRPRPSLPSLDTLAKMNVVVPPKVRRGHVGAGLPAEPWDLEHSVPNSATSATFLDLSDEDEEAPRLVHSPTALKADPLPLPPPPVPSKSPVPPPTTEEQPPAQDDDDDASDDALAYVAFAALGGLADADDEHGAALTRSLSVELGRTSSDSGDAPPELSFSSSTDAGEPESELSYTHSRGSSSASSSTSGSASASASVPTSPKTRDAQRRRRFRKSSLVGDVLRFAPASPPGAPGASAGADEVREAEGMDIDLNTGGDLDLDLDDMDMDMDMDMEFGGREVEEEEVGVGGEEEEEAEEDDADADALTPAELDAALNRLSTANDLGHEPLDGVGVGVAFPSAYPLREWNGALELDLGREVEMETEGPRYAASHAIMRSPERYSDASPPFSTPYDTPFSTPYDSASASSPESTSSAPGGFDFGWLPGERGSASTSGSEFEYDGSGSSGREFEYDDEVEEDGDAPMHIHVHANAHAPPPSASAMYSDDELSRSFTFPARPEFGYDGYGGGGGGLEYADAEDDAHAHAPPPTPAPVSAPASAMYSDDELSRSFTFPTRAAHAHAHLAAPDKDKDKDSEDPEPGTSAGTIRASARVGRPMSMVRDRRFWAAGEGGEGEGEVDGSGWEEGRRGEAGGSRGGGAFAGGGGGGGGAGRARSAGRGGDDGYPSSGGWAGGGGDDDDEDERRRKSSFSTPSSSSSSDSEEEEEDEEDDYGEPSASVVPKPAAAAADTGNDANSEDDDIPLAQRIPSALVAQRTIRRKVREEREERRRERGARRALRGGEGARSRQTTLRPAGAGDAAQSPLAVASSSREAARQAEASLQRARTRTQTLPGNGPGAPNAAVDDLTKKLQSMQSSQAERQRALTINTAAAAPASVGRERILSPSPARVSESVSPPARGVRAVRSFHRPATAGAAPPLEVPLPADAEARVRRSTTTRRAVDDSRLHRGDAHQGAKARALTMPAPRADAPPASPLLPQQPAPNKLTKAPPPAQEVRAGRASGEMVRVGRVSGEMVRSPEGGLATPPQAHRHAASRSQGTLTRVFIGDMQRFNMVDIGPATSAKHVLAMVEEQGSLKGWVGTGGWMVWEIAQDFGMERPIRSFELLADVQASWNKDKMVNTFVIKLTPLAPILSRSNIPTSSPTFSGYVDWEIKRGKWTKRYLRLREHSLWLCKRENGKDEVFLCSLSNFDAYNVTRLHKAPKPFVFAVKSTDNLSFFENTADYLHIFACNPRDGDKWVEKILHARSYVLHQERNVF
ncbi:hypothetical protein B0H11DRAFT_2412101 [Mycena galericulata]|nr:hypothetical protein B0H11DRAFT_2412101 [Mycena galericulata]